MHSLILLIFGTVFASLLTYGGIRIVRDELVIGGYLFCLAFVLLIVELWNIGVLTS